jgi:hypothetical protein
MTLIDLTYITKRDLLQVKKDYPHNIAPNTSTNKTVHALTLYKGEKVAPHSTTAQAHHIWSLIVNQCRKKQKKCTAPAQLHNQNSTQTMQMPNAKRHKQLRTVVVHRKPHTTTNTSNQKLPKRINLFSTDYTRNTEQLIVRRENVMLKYALTLQL